jgi:hypothetical protein
MTTMLLYISPVQHGAHGCHGARDIFFWRPHKHIQLSRFLILIQIVRHFFETLLFLLLVVVVVVVVLSSRNNSIK